MGAQESVLKTSNNTEMPGDQDELCLAGQTECLPTLYMKK